MTDDLIRRLRDADDVRGWNVRQDAAAALEAQAKRIAELEEARNMWMERVDVVEADLAAARDCIRDLAGQLTDFVGDFRHIDAIAAARGEQPKPDVCPTCAGVVLGIGVCPACGTGKKETK